MQLHEVPHIKLDTKISVDRITVRELSNFFRTFKQPEETISHDCIYSPFLRADDSDGYYKLDDDYIARTEMLDSLKDRFKGYFISLYLAYNFANAPIDLKYTTDKEFRYIGKMIDEIITGTNLSFLLFVSHFTQFADKQGTALKPEHFHCVIGNSDCGGFAKEMAHIKAKTLAQKLKENSLLTVKGNGLI